MSERYEQMILEAVAEMFAERELRKHRLSCECDDPRPGEWSIRFWTTCSRCNRQLSLKHYASRQP